MADRHHRAAVGVSKSSRPYESQPHNAPVPRQWYLHVSQGVAYRLGLELGTLLPATCNHFSRRGKGEGLARLTPTHAATHPGALPPLILHPRRKLTYTRTHSPVWLVVPHSSTIDSRIRPSHGFRPIMSPEWGLGSENGSNPPNMGPRRSRVRSLRAQNVPSAHHLSWKVHQTHVGPTGQTIPGPLTGGGGRGEVTANSNKTHEGWY